MNEQRRTLDAWVATGDAVAAPLGVNAQFWQSIVPAANPGTAAQVALGRKLDFETRLSKDGSVSCATCHDVSRGFVDRRNTSEGIGDPIGRRNAPPTVNAAFFVTQFWDGRAPSLEEQARLPIVNPIEMGMPDGDSAAAAIAGDPKYQAAFQAAYGRAPNYEDIGRALAAFERTWCSSPRRATASCAVKRAPSARMPARVSRSSTARVAATAATR